MPDDGYSHLYQCTFKGRSVTERLFLCHLSAFRASLDEPGSEVRTTDLFCASKRTRNEQGLREFGAFVVHFRA